MRPLIVLLAFFFTVPALANDSVAVVITKQGAVIVTQLDDGTVSIVETNKVTVLGEPTPGPGPNPGPNPTTFKGKIAAAYKLVKTKREYAKRVAGILNAIASEVEADNTDWTGKAMVKEVKHRLSQPGGMPQDGFVPWRVYWPAQAKAFADEELDNSDIDGHIKLLRAAASVLSQRKKS